jgi:RNA methyltransferase, TrmH family
VYTTVNKVSHPLPDIITSTRNPRIVNLRKLDQRKHRAEQGRFAVEGLQSLHMALDSGIPPLEVFYCEALFTGTEAPVLLEQFQQRGASPFPVSAEVMHSLSERDSPQGIIATFELVNRSLASLSMTGNQLVIVLDRLSDPGNLGTILRTADAVGSGAVVIMTPASDPFDPKTVRASMGSVFNIPVVQTGDVMELFEWLHEHGIRPMGADAVRGRKWTELDWRGSVALVLGNEARGLSKDVSEQIEMWVALPIAGKADSLNVAVAGGVLMYTWVAANGG